MAKVKNIKNMYLGGPMMKKKKKYIKKRMPDLRKIVIKGKNWIRSKFEGRIN